jgi:putative transposase
LASRNERKPPDAAGVLFHVYNRGVARQPIFRTRTDYLEFLDCFKRYLTPKPYVDSWGRPYRKLHEGASLVSFCLMPNHFHLVVLQHRNRGLETLMKSAIGGYVKQFNHKYEREGPLFQGRYKARVIDSHDYARRVISYIHLNHPDGLQHEFSSHRNFTGEREADWIDAAKGLSFFGGATDYAGYITREVQNRKALA